MASRRFGAVGLALLLVVSGCSGLVPVDWQDAIPGGGDGTRYPPGYNETGITDSEAALDSHVDGIRSYESYTLTYRATHELPERTRRLTTTTSVDTVERRVHEVSTIGETGYAMYHAGNNRYERTTSPNADEPTYRAERQTLVLESVSGRKHVGGPLTWVNYTEARTVGRNGERLLRYEAHTVPAGRKLLEPAVSGENVTAFSATLLVSSAGVVRHLEYEATVDRAEGRGTIRVVLDVSKINGTTVDRHDWVDRAASS